MAQGEQVARGERALGGPGREPAYVEGPGPVTSSLRITLITHACTDDAGAGTTGFLLLVV